MKNNIEHTLEDNIDLIELFSIINKRKKIIFATTLLFTILAIIYIFITKPVYEVKSMIEVGEIANVPIDNINDIKQKLEYTYQVNIKNKKVELPRLNKITIPKKSKNIFQITAIGYSNDEASNYIHTIINKIEKDDKEKIDAFIDNQKQLIKFINNDITNNTRTLVQMKKELNTYNNKIISLKREDAALAGIYALQIGQKQIELQKLTQYISTLNTKRQDLELSISPFKVKQTHLVGQIEILEKPIKPKKKLIVFSSFFIGLFLSIFLVFFLEVIQKIQSERKKY